MKMQAHLNNDSLGHFTANQTKHGGTAVRDCSRDVPTTEKPLSMKATFFSHS